MQDSKESNRSQSKSKDKLSKIVTLFTVPLCLLLLWLIDSLHPIPFTSKLLICVVLLLVTLIWSEAVPPLRLASLRRFWKSRKKRYTKLYTPQDVDAFSVQSGIACDCSVLDENIFMGNSDEVVRAISDQNILTWANSFCRIPTCMLMILIKHFWKVTSCSHFYTIASLPNTKRR